MSPSHIKNSGDLLNRMKDINIQNKTRNSLDITSLNSNIPIRKGFNLLPTNLRKIKFNSTLSMNTRINICKYITNMIYFKFNNNFNKQKQGHPIGNPHSGIFICLFLELKTIWPFYIQTTKQHHIFQIYRWYTNIHLQKHQNWKDRRKNKQCWNFLQLHQWKRI